MQVLTLKPLKYYWLRFLENIKNLVIAKKPN